MYIEYDQTWGLIPGFTHLSRPSAWLVFREHGPHRHGAKQLLPGVVSDGVAHPCGIRFRFGLIESLFL